MIIEDIPGYHDCRTTQDYGVISKHRVNHLLALYKMATMLQTPQGQAEAFRLSNEIWRAIERLPVKLSVSESGKYW